MRNSRILIILLALSFLATLAVPVRADDEDDFYNALREKQRREKAIK